jgi:Ca-activated chloride channel family protein
VPGRQNVIGFDIVSSNGLMKYLKAIVVLGVVLLLAGLTFKFAAAQGPGSQQSETVAKPKKKDAPAEATDQPKIPSKFSKKDKDVPEGLPTFSSDVNTVQLEVAVLDNRGHFIPNIPRGNFRVLEDNVPQQISGFTTNADAPMTIAMVIEFNALFQQYWSQGWYETLVASYGFIETLKPEDYVAIVAYDMRPEILTDFTTDRGKIQEAMQRLRIPGFSESNMYDALVDTGQRMSNIEGRKAILLVATGRDTFSKLTFDKARKGIQENGVPIYAISLLQAFRAVYDTYMPDTMRMDFLQADNQLNTFTRETGGQAFFPRFYGEFPNIFREIGNALRNQYSIAYNPSNQVKDGKFRKIKVELVNPDNGEQLRIVDQKKKPIKYSIVAKQGYTAPRAVE